MWLPAVYLIASVTEKFSGGQVKKNHSQETHQINISHVSIPGTLSRDQGGGGHVGTWGHMYLPTQLEVSG